MGSFNLQRKLAGEILEEEMVEDDDSDETDGLLLLAVRSNVVNSDGAQVELVNVVVYSDISKRGLAQGEHIEHGIGLDLLAGTTVGEEVDDKLGGYKVGQIVTKCDSNRVISHEIIWFVQKKE